MKTGIFYNSLEMV